MTDLPGNILADKNNGNVIPLGEILECVLNCLHSRLCNAGKTEEVQQCKAGETDTCGDRNKLNNLLESTTR